MDRQFGEALALNRLRAYTKLHYEESKNRSVAQQPQGFVWFQCLTWQSHILTNSTDLQLPSSHIVYTNQLSGEQIV